MFERYQPILIAGLLATAGTAACAEVSAYCPENDLACTESDGKLDGTGPGTGTGQLVIVRRGSAQVAMFARRADGAGPSLAFESGVARPVSPGTYCVSTQPDTSIQFATDADCEVVVEAGQTVRYELGAVNFIRGTGDLVWGIDVPRFTPDVRQPEALALLSKTIRVGHAAGRHSYEYLYQRSVVFDVVSGETATIDLTATTKRTIRLHPSTGRTLPDLPRQLQLCRDPGSSCLGFPAAAEAPILIIERDNTEPSITIGGHYSRQRHARISYPAEIHLRRIDLDPVRVELADGSVEMVNGTATIYLDLPGAGIQLLGAESLPYVEAVPTGYGIDVVPGKYHVYTRFVHPVDGALLTIRSDLDLR
jgi:hypothetical protein